MPGPTPAAWIDEDPLPYKMSLPLNGLTMTRGEATNARDPRARTCPAYGFLLNRWDVDWDLRKKPSGSPMLSATTDMFYIASPSFLRRYEEEGCYGLNFRPLSCGYVEIRPDRTVRMVANDVPFEEPTATKPWPITNAVIARDGLFTIMKREPRCKDCGEWPMIYSGGAMVIGAEEPPIGDLEIVGTDIHHFNKTQRTFILIAGDGVSAAHKRKKMGGLFLSSDVIHAGQDGAGEAEALKGHAAARAHLKFELKALAEWAELQRRHEERVARREQALAEGAARSEQPDPKP